MSRSEREDAQKNLIEHIQKQARFLGWKELAKADPGEIRRYIDAAEKLNSELESAAKTVGGGQWSVGGRQKTVVSSQ